MYATHVLTPVAAKTSAGTDPAADQWHGSLRLIRELSPHKAAARWLAADDRSGALKILYRFPARTDRAAQRRFLAAARRAAGFEHAHVLPLAHASIDALFRGCIVAPYVGSNVGLMTLDDLIAAKGGVLKLTEAERAAAHLLEALAAASDAGIHHGPIDSGHVLVDRSGRLLIELFGLEQAMKVGDAETDSANVRQLEVKSVVELIYQFTTGAEPHPPVVSPSTFAPGLPAAWEDWMMHGLEPARGYTSAREALRRLPTPRRIARSKRTPRMQVMLRHWSRVIGVL